MFPFSKYHIATSHNSYLPSSQIFCSSRNSVVRALEEGARAIELDLWRHPLSNPGDVIVTHGSMCGACTCLVVFPHKMEKILASISKYLDSLPIVNKEFLPVFIQLELNISLKEDQDFAGKCILDAFAGKLVTGKVDLCKDSPESFRGKVLIACGGGIIHDSVLGSVVNVDFSNESATKNMARSDILRDVAGYKRIIDSGGAIRCYPENIIISRNEDPNPLFDVGVQFVAMNYQTHDAALETYKKKFPTLGPDLGYVLRK